MKFSAYNSFAYLFNLSNNREPLVGGGPCALHTLHMPCYGPALNTFFSFFLLLCLFTCIYYILYPQLGNILIYRITTYRTCWLISMMRVYNISWLLNETDVRETCRLQYVTCVYHISYHIKFTTHSRHAAFNQIPVLNLIWKGHTLKYIRYITWLGNTIHISDTITNVIINQTLLCLKEYHKIICFIPNSHDINSN